MSVALVNMDMEPASAEERRRRKLEEARELLAVADTIRSTRSTRRALAHVEAELAASPKPPTPYVRRALGSRQAQVLSELGHGELTENALAQRMHGCGYPVGPVLAALVAMGRVRAVDGPPGFAKRWAVV